MARTAVLLLSRQGWPLQLLTTFQPKVVRNLSGDKRVAACRCFLAPVRMTPSWIIGTALRSFASSADRPYRKRLANFLTIAFPVSGVSVLAWGFLYPDKEPPFPVNSQRGVSNSTEAIINWSGTHQVNPRRYYQPETEEEVERLVKEAHGTGQRLRAVGSALSPNGIAFSNDGMLSMALLDKVISVDVEKMQVTAQAGCRVQQVADAIRPYGLTLQNYASIREQQLGGFTQVGAHGTGASIPPVDDSVVALTVATPGRGTLHLSADGDADLLRWVRLSLGTLGVVTRMTLQCVKAHELVEETLTASIKEVQRNHASWLKSYQHLRYMWVPGTDSVVVVRSNPLKSESERKLAQQPPKYSEEQRAKQLKDLLLQRTGQTDADVAGMTATQLRDDAYACAPLDVEWVRKVNAAEAANWRLSSGWRMGWSDEILGFDCGGQQWVHEMCFPVGSPADIARRRPSEHPELQYMAELYKEIEVAGIPAHSPIEMRWTSSSSSPLSPAYSSRPSDVYCWVGVIMYLPDDDPQQRDAITQAFSKYRSLVEAKLAPKFQAVQHWAKLEVPPEAAAQEQLRHSIAQRFPVQRFAELRSQLDPKNILGNHIVDVALPVKA